MGIKKDKTIMYITYTVVLAFVLFNYKEVLNIIMNIISLATPFYIAVVIAFILNIPMKKIENLLSKKIKKKNILPHCYGFACFFTSKTCSKAIST